MWAKKVRKRIRGEQITSMDQVVKACKENQVLWIKSGLSESHKAPGVILSMTVFTVQKFIDQGMLFYSEINPEWEKQQNNKFK